MNIDEIKKKLEAIKDSDITKIDQIYNFMVKLISQSKTENIGAIYTDGNYKTYLSIIYNQVKIIHRETAVLDKLLNNRNDIIRINTILFFNNALTINIYYDFVVNNNLYSGITSKNIKHKLKTYKNTDKSKIINEYREIDITNNYLNNIFLVSENIKDNIIKIEFDKKIVIDFINLSIYNKKMKNDNIKLVDTLPDKFAVSDLFTIYRQANKQFTYNQINKPIEDFINLIFNNVFIKSISKDLLNYDDKNIAYDGIIDLKTIEKLNFFNGQYRILEEIL